MNKFAVFFYLAFVGAAVATPVLDADDLACIAETKVSESAVRKFNEEFEFDENDHSFKCFIKCSMLQDKLVNEAGEYNPAELVDFIVKLKDAEDTTTTEEKMALFSICDNSDVTGDSCEKAAAAGKCLMDLFKAILKLIAEDEAAAAETN